MENGAISQGEGKDPSSFLSDIIGNPVTVKLNSGVVYKAERLTCDDTADRMELTLAGELQSVDGYMNIALEKTAEYVNGQKRREYGDAFVRGNNGECCSVMGRNLANRR
ncbi:u6 snRNA-associated Sm LSm6 [Fusarium napiforme]|uniref:U6 snRNA-associated Sm-like protein LSm6 n=1 Tax=Fusarium napiforme TaxID=42672 RepID=A0A8H5MM94_9HYPO|nr:u6 snRNA-associated Sm LSm6 [Fusarium napiforme]